MTSVHEIRIDKDLAVLKREVECVDVDSEDTDFSVEEGDEEEVPVDIIVLDDIKDEQEDRGDGEEDCQITHHIQVEVEVKEEPLEPVPYNNSKYYNKRRTVITEIIQNSDKSVETVQLVSEQSENRFIGRYFETSEATAGSVEDKGIESASNKRKLICDKSVMNLGETPGNNVEVIEYIKVEVNPSDIIIKKEPLEEETNPSAIIIKQELLEEIKVEELDAPVLDDSPRQGFDPKDKIILDKYNTVRTWRYTRLGEDINKGVRTMYSDNTRFRILTYNILSQSNLERQRHLYKKKKNYILSWEYRLRELQREIASLDPDIICFQEIEFANDNTVNEDILEFLSYKGYQHKGQKRTGDKKDGCAIFFKTILFECEEFKSVKFKKDEFKFLSGNNVGLICRLRAVKIAQRVVVGTIHLQFGVKKHLTRLAQIALFLADLNEVAKYRGTSLPCILAGDFNLEPYTDVHRLITKGHLTYRGLACGKGHYPALIFPPAFGLSEDLTWELGEEYKVKSERSCSGSFTHGFGFRSVYQYRQERNLYLGFAPPENEVTAYQGKWVSVDHIFYSTVPSQWCYNSDGRVEKNLKLLCKWSLPSATQISRLGGLPSTIAPSDHLPLAADFLLSTRP